MSEQESGRCCAAGAGRSCPSCLQVQTIKWEGDTCHRWLKSMEGRKSEELSWISAGGEDAEEEEAILRAHNHPPTR